MVGRRNRRFVSDELRFTGIDLSNGSSSLTQRRRQHGTEDEDDSSESDEDEDDFHRELAQLSPQEQEEYLVESAMHQMRVAQSQGRTDVNLRKEELAALERRRKKLEEEAAEREKEKKKKRSARDDKKKKAETRIAVPIAQLEPISRKGKSTRSRQASISRNSSINDMADMQGGQAYPPMGYFPPPSSRTRPRSGTHSSSRPPSRAYDDHGPPPFEYEYVSRPSSVNRHSSDPYNRPRSGTASNEQLMMPHGSSDPFQYQTAGPRAPYSHGAAAASRRQFSGPSEMAYLTGRGSGSPAAARSRHGRHRGGSEDTDSRSSDQSTSDDLGNGAQIREPQRGREEIIVDVSPEPEAEPKKKSSGTSPSKRKPATRSSGRRKKK